MTTPPPDTRQLTEPEPMGAKVWLKEVEPRLRKGMTPEAIAVELEADVGYVRELITTWTTPHALKVGPELFSDVRGVIAQHYFMEEGWHCVVTTLFVLQAWVTEVLPIVFFLFVGGTRGTGKTNFETLVASLTDALMFGDVSVPAMARTMRHGRTVIIDEVDVSRGKEYDEVRDALTRSGYKSNAPPYVRWDAAKKAADEIPVFGPRMLGYRGSIEDALQSRGYFIPSVTPNGEEGYEYVLRNFWPELGDLPTRLKFWGEDARKAFPEDKLKEIAFSAGFREKVKAVVGKLGANRESELATVALLVAEMAGVDVLAELKSANDLREIETFSASDSTLDDLRDVVVDLSGIAHEKLLCGAPEVRIRQSEVRSELNRRLKERGERLVGDKRFAKLRQDLGVKDEWLRRPGNALTWVLPEPWIRGLSPTVIMANMANLTPYEEKLGKLTMLANGEGGQEGQNPYRMRGLERALEVRRLNPHRPVGEIVDEVVRELRVQGYNPDIDEVTAGVIKGMKPREDGKP